MKTNREITLAQARELISRLGLKSGDYFTNTEPSELCYEYRIETGYYLPFGNSRLVLLSTTKDNEGLDVTRATLSFNAESLGIDEDEPTEEQKEKAKPVAAIISEVVGDLFLVEIK